MRQSELKRKYDPELGRYVKKHVYGEGISDVMKSIGSRVLGKTTKELASDRINQLISAGKYKQI